MPKIPLQQYLPPPPPGKPASVVAPVPPARRHCPAPSDDQAAAAASDQPLVTCATCVHGLPATDAPSYHQCATGRRGHFGLAPHHCHLHQPTTES